MRTASTKGSQTACTGILCGLYDRNGEVDMCSIRADLEAVDKAIKVVENALEREMSSSQPDTHGRIAAEMPASIRMLYESGNWKEKACYHWDRAVKVSNEGHRKAKIAEEAFKFLSHCPQPGPAGVAQAAVRCELAAAVTNASSAAHRVGRDVKEGILRRMYDYDTHMWRLSTRYLQLENNWSAGLKIAREELSKEQAEAAIARDRELFLATRATTGMGGGVNNKEIDDFLAEIHNLGGTAGGVSRWASSLASIPVQNMKYSPPDTGIYLEDPLGAYYLSRSVNPWTRAESLLFLEKYLIHHKDFKRIAMFFEHKSVEDVVQFYFKHKEALKLKQLFKDAQLKRRTIKKHSLIELAQMPTDSRCIKFHPPGWPSEDIDCSKFRTTGAGRQISVESSAEDVFLTRGEHTMWSFKERQALVFALCRHEVCDDLRSPKLPVVWCRIAVEVGTKTPQQCRKYFATFRDIQGLGNFRPPKVVEAVKGAKRPRSVSSDDSEDENRKDRMVKPKNEQSEGDPDKVFVDVQSDKAGTSHVSITQTDAGIERSREVDPTEYKGPASSTATNENQESRPYLSGASEGSLSDAILPSDAEVVSARELSAANTSDRFVDAEDALPSAVAVTAEADHVDATPVAAETTPTAESVSELQVASTVPVIASTEPSSTDLLSAATSGDELADGTVADAHEPSAD